MIYCHRNGLPRFVKNVGHKKKVLSWVLNSDRVGRSRRPAGSEFQTDGAMNLNEHSSTDFKLRFGIFKSF